MDAIIITFFILTFVSLFYVMVRNEKVFRFLRKVNFTCSERLSGYLDSVEDVPFYLWMDEYKGLDAMADEIRSLEYCKVLYSFKPLEFESWFTKEQCHFLRNKMEYKDVVSKNEGV